MEVFQVRLRRLSEYGSVAYLVGRPTRETQAEQYSDTVHFSVSVLGFVFFNALCVCVCVFVCLVCLVCASGKEKAHKLLRHELFEKAVTPGTTSRLTRRMFSGFGGEHINFLSGQPAGCPGVNRTLTRAKSLCLRPVCFLPSVFARAHLQEPTKASGFTTDVFNINQPGGTLCVYIYIYIYMRMCMCPPTQVSGTILPTILRSKCFVKHDLLEPD